MEEFPELKDIGKMMFLTVNTNIKAKFVQVRNSNLVNPPIGTLIDHSITKSKDSYEFYLINTTASQGVPTPTHYSVIYDDIQMDPKNVQ